MSVASSRPGRRACLWRASSSFGRGFRSLVLLRLAGRGELLHKVTRLCPCQQRDGLATQCRPSGCLCWPHGLSEKFGHADLKFWQTCLWCCGAVLCWPRNRVRGVLAAVNVPRTRRVRIARILSREGPPPRIGATSTSTTTRRRSPRFRPGHAAAGYPGPIAASASCVKSSTI